MYQPKHVCLFSGIGGFALAARWAGFETIRFCEIEPFCRAVLRKHWPEVPIEENILHFDAKPLRGRVDLLTGGFPCQPYSVAGKKQGRADNRALWPEMLRVIEECQPTWVVGENVDGFVSMAQFDSEPPMEANGAARKTDGGVFRRVGFGVANDALEALESLGYEVQTFVIPACAVNAPHRRDRIWIVAYSERAGIRGNEHQRRWSAETEQIGMVGNSSENAVSVLDGGMSESGHIGEFGNAGTGSNQRHIGEADKWRDVTDSAISEQQGDKAGVCAANSGRESDRYQNWETCSKQSGTVGQNGDVADADLQSGIGRGEPCFPASSCGEAWTEPCRSDAHATDANCCAERNEGGREPLSVCGYGETRQDVCRGSASSRKDGDDTHSCCARAAGHTGREEQEYSLLGNGGSFGNANSTGRQEQRIAESARTQLATFERADWRQIEPLLCPQHHGLPGGLARPRGWRNAALKATGNAIVPQVAYEILMLIAESLKGEA